MFSILFLIIICNLSKIYCQDELCLKQNLTESNNCDLKIKFLEEKEKVVLVEACKKHTNLIDQSDVIYIHNGVVNSTGKFKNCEQFQSDIIQLAWLSLEAYQRRLDMIKTYQKTLIAKASNGTLTTSSICSYETTTKTCGAHLIHPNKTDFENEIYLLVQLRPLTYTIFDINYKVWMNDTSGDREVPIGKLILKNYLNMTEKVYDTIRYGFYEKIKFNSSKIGENLKGQYEYSQNYIDVNEHGEGNFFRKLNHTFSHVLPPQSYANVSLIGIWADHVYEISSAILQFEYGNGYLTTKHIEHFQISVSRIINLKTEYTNPFSLDTNEEIEFTFEEMNAKAYHLISEYKVSDDYLTQQGSIYPGFHPYFIVGCVIFCVVTFIGLFGVCRGLIKDRNERKYRKVPTYRT